MLLLGKKGAPPHGPLILFVGLCGTGSNLKERKSQEVRLSEGPNLEML